jgi:hypothetical protein
MDSATQGTKNIIANRLMAVSESSSMGERQTIEVQFLFMTDGSTFVVAGSSPTFPMVLS